MRRKPNLEPRMEATKDYLLRHEDYYFYKNKQVSIIDYREVFGNDNPVELDIGCGLGQFVNELASKNPDVNYLALEKTSNVIVTAMEKTQRLGLTNVKYMCCAAENIPYYLTPHTVRRIYLNFSTPLPKAGYVRQRLTNPRFLAIYRDTLVQGGEIWQKTDNMGFFEYSLAQFSQNGFKLKDISLDLHNSDFTDNIVTEYESKFLQKGQPIYRLIAYTDGE